MMKKFCAVFCAIVLVMSTIAGSVLAVEPEQTVIDLGDGFYAIDSLVQYPMGRSGDEVCGAKSRNIYYGSTLIGIATLYACFDISGSSAKATAASIAGEGRNGCTYLRGTTSGSGNKASGTAYFRYEGVEKYTTISISCSPSGELS